MRSDFEDDVLYEDDPEIKEEEAAVPEPVPDAQMVFDADVAELWLRDANARKQGVFLSIRFEPDGMPEKQLDFLLSMAAKAIGGKMYTHKGALRGTGTLFVPQSLAKAPVLSSLEEVDIVGYYVVFQRKE
jgi:hypothetical protein